MIRTLRLTWMLSRPGTQSLSAVLLPAGAFAVVTTLVLLLLGGVEAFWRWTDENAFVYQALSIIALALLLVPLLGLGGAAARLSARRRDDRLSTLRLLGATPGTVTAITVLESAVVALAGALAGVILALALAPLVGLIPFRGEPLGGGALLLPAWTVAVVIAATTVLAAVSASIGLRGVIVTPLGVRTRQRAPRQHWIRVVIGAAVILVAFVAMQALQVAGSIIVIIAVLGIGFGGTLAVLNLVGPWALRLLAKRQARVARTAPRLMAARTILESPKAAWRQVSGVAMASFMAVFAGTGVALVGLTPDSGPDAAETAALFADIRTGVLVTVAASFLMVACSVVVNQLSDIFDQRALYVSLDRLGMPRRAMHAARSRAVLYPLRVATLGSAVAAAIVVFPLAGLALILAPLSVAVIVAVLVAGVLLVLLSLRFTRPAVTAVLEHPERA